MAGGLRDIRPSLPLGILAALWMALAAPAAQATGTGCGPVAGLSYEIRVRVDVPPMHLNRDVSREQLGGFAPHGPGASVLGLTTTGYEVSTSSHYSHHYAPGGHCLWIDSVDVFLRYHSMDVFVASEYKPGGCAYRAILAHEQQHVDVARTYVQRYQPRIRAALTSLRIPTARAPTFVKDPEAARGQLDALLRELLEPVYRQLQEDMAAAQAALDTPQSYARVFRQCSDW